MKIQLIMRKHGRRVSMSVLGNSRDNAAVCGGKKASDWFLRIHTFFKIVEVELNWRRS